MGADFIGTFIKAPTVSKEEAFIALAAMSNRHLDELFTDVSGHDADPENPEAEEGREFFTDMLRSFYDEIVNYNNREVGVWLIGDQPYLVTGGMSWGDEPTEAYKVIEAMNALNITNGSEDTQ
jgi:hypothetical protein